LVVSGILFGIPFLILGYIAAWFILDEKPYTQGKSNNTKFNKPDKSCDYENESIKVKTRIWQSGEPPKQAFHDIRKKFGSLEQQLQSIEQYVTSSEFTVAREINKL
jgi:phage shock protein C